jgi:hypothetical protein
MVLAMLSTRCVSNCTSPERAKSSGGSRSIKRLVTLPPQGLSEPEVHLGSVFF